MLAAVPSFSSQNQFHATRSRVTAEQISPAQRTGLFRANLRPRAERASTHRAAKMQSQQLTPGPLATSFVSAVQIPAGGSPNSPFASVMGDFNADGHMDVATVVNYNTAGAPKYAISVVLSNGNGTFQSPILTHIANAEFDPIWVGDLDGMKGDDIVIGHQATATTTASVDVWLSNGDGTFGSGGNPNGTFPVTTVNADNIVWATLTPDTGSGHLDLVVADAANPGNIWTLLGVGDGTFGAPAAVAFTGALGAVPVAFADFNHDGFLDFAATSSTNNQVMVYLNNSGTSYTAVALKTPDSIYDACNISTGDLHGDVTHPDISVANCQDNNLLVYVNDGSGGFGTTAPPYYYAGRVPEGLAIADINGDGKNDIVAADAFGGDVSVLLGNGDGTLQTPVVGYATGGYPGGNPFAFSNYPTVPPLVADFNGDGHMDVIVADSFFSFVFLPGYGDGSFRSTIDYYAPVGLKNPFAVGMASGDFNGDGITDYVIGNSKSFAGSRTGITLFLGNPDGSLQTGVPHGGESTTGILSHVAVADFNKDGKLDVAASDLANGGVQIFIGNGDGTFQAPGNPYATDTQTTYVSTSVVTGDFNGDGYPDIAVVNAYNSGANFDVGVLINDTKGGFKPVATYALNAPTQAGAAEIIAEITAADLNHDGKVDLLVPLFGTQSAPGSVVAVLYGKGDGTFQAESDVNTSTNPFYAAVGDFNGDGIPDMAVSSDDGPANFQGIDVVVQKPLGTFTLFHQYQSTAQDTSLHVPVPTFIRLADVNHDGFLDLVYTNSNFGTVGVLYGDGKGNFPAGPLEYAAGGNAYNLLLADVNHGGALDVVTGDGNASELTVVLNTTSAPNLLTSSGSPSIAGLSVTFTADISAVRGVTGVPTGTVTFYDGATALGGPVTLNSGAAALKTSSLTGGSHNITAQYGGDVNFSTSTSAPLQQVITKATDSTGVASSVNPSAVGQQVVFTATVSNTVSGSIFVATGSVTFFDGTTSLGAAPLNSKGVATLNVSSLAVGSHNITAQYGGDVSFDPSTSPALVQKVAGADYTLTASPTSVNVNPGSSAQFTITLTPLYGYNGTVTFTCPAQLPTGVTCTLPSPLKVNGSQPIKAALTINTKGPSAALDAPQNLNRPAGDPNLWASLTGFGMLGLVVAGDWKKRKRRHIAIGIAILAVVMILAMAGCGSGSSTGSGTGGGSAGTPAGNYKIQVTATGTGNNQLPHLVTATINVQ
jgi:hypothetical protein